MPRRLYAQVNIIGPDGVLLPAGEPIPEEWDGDLVDHLRSSGGAGSSKPSSGRPEPTGAGHALSGSASLHLATGDPA